MLQGGPLAPSGLLGDHLNDETLQAPTPSRQARKSPTSQALGNEGFSQGVSVGTEWPGTQTGGEDRDADMSQRDREMRAGMQVSGRGATDTDIAMEVRAGGSGHNRGGEGGGVLGGLSYRSNGKVRGDGRDTGDMDRVQTGHGWRCQGGAWAEMVRVHEETDSCQDRSWES